VSTKNTARTSRNGLGSLLRVTIAVTALALTVSALSGCGGGKAAVTGTVTYLQRIALPDDAVVNVQLQDVSKADAPAEVVGEQEFKTGGEQVPFPYKVEYKAGDIVDNHTYVVRAEIRDAAGKLLFTTTTAYPVITRGSPTQDVEIILEQVG
jgi:uncharacterized lipoprotein YbaY